MATGRARLEPADATAVPRSPVVPTRFTNPNSRMRVATNATIPSAMPRAGEPGGDGSVIGDRVARVGRIGRATGPADQVGGHLDERALEPRIGGIRQQPIEGARRVRDEIDVERADPLLEDAPHRLAEVGDDPHQGQPGKPIGPDGTVVGGQQDLVLGGRQLMVDAEVAEIEERVAHPGVFPVDDPDPRAVVDEVRVEQVVVARPQLDRVRQEGHLDPAADRRGRVVRRRDGDPARERQRPIRLDDPKRHEQPGDRRPVVDPAQRVGDPPERLGSVDGLVADRRPDDEPRDEVALGRMNAVTSGPTPTPAAATVAACSTSRLMPSRCVSLPASRMTQRSSVPAASTRKFRFVIPPDRAVSVSSRPLISGTFWSARTRSS